MAKVESKSKINIDIEVKSGSEKAGHISLSSGNMYYFRANAKKETAKYTYLQLIDLIERDINE